MVNAEDRECRVFSDDVPTSIRGRPLCRRGSSNRVAIARQPRRRHVLPKFPSRRVASGQSAQFLADGEGSEVIGRSLSLSLSLSPFLPAGTPLGGTGGNEIRFPSEVSRGGACARGGERGIVQEFAPHTSSISDSMAYVKVNRYREEIASRR